MNSTFDSRRGMVMGGGLWLLSGPAALLLCLSGVLMGLLQPVLMRPQAYQPNRAPDLLFGRDDCPGCEWALFTDCVQPNDYKCGLCMHIFNYPLVTLGCAKKVSHFSREEYTQCISQKHPNYVCNDVGEMTCFTTWECNTSKTHQDMKCEDADPPACTVSNQKGWYCRHCHKAGGPVGEEKRNMQNCIPCDPEGS